MNATTATGARLARPDEAHELSRTLAAAFFDDPVMHWVLPDPRRRRELLPGYCGLDVLDALDNGAAMTTPGHDAVGLWATPDPPPGTEEHDDGTSTAAVPSGYGKDATPPDDREALVAALERVTEEYHPAALELFDLMKQHRPTTPHYYLALLGTRPEHQGRGLGSALLTPVLSRCDREGAPAYTESSNLRNIRLYERRGFEVIDELTLPDGPPLWPMWRQPRIEGSPS